MLKNNQKGLTILQILIWILIFGLLIGGFFLLLNREKATSRDAKRMSDMSRLQAAFELLYSEKGSYAEAVQNGCSQKGWPVRACNLAKYLPGIATFKDPGGGDYLVARVPDDTGYEIIFSLERNYDGLKAGRHVLSQEGIK